MYKTTCVVKNKAQVKSVWPNQEKGKIKLWDSNNSCSLQKLSGKLEDVKKSIICVDGRERNNHKICDGNEGRNEKYEEAPYTPYPDESRGEREAGAKWWGTLGSNFTLCAVEYPEGFET